MSHRSVYMRIILLWGVIFVLCGSSRAGGSIGGTITDETGSPISDIWVDAYDDNGDWVKSGLAQASGSYLINDLTTGNYYLRTYSENANYIDEWYDDVRATSWNVQPAAQSVSVIGGTTNRNIDFVLAEGAVVSGVVTDLLDQPISNVWVDAYNPNGIRIVSAYSGVNGEYELTGVSGNTCFIRTDAYGMNYADEWYDNIPALGTNIPSDAASLGLAVGVGTSNINFSLADGAVVRGNITDAFGVPLTNVWLDVYTTNLVRIASVLPSASGDYEADSLPAATYCAKTYSGYENYADEWYDNIPYVKEEIPAEAESFAIAAGGVKTDVDFSLKDGGVVSGRLMDMNGSAVTSVVVNLYNASNIWLADSGTDENGQYSFSDLHADDYYVLTMSLDVNYVNEWYNDAVAIGWDIPEEAGPVTVSSGVISSNIDFDLEAGGFISGVVTDTNGVPIADVIIDIYNADTNWVKSTTTSSNGTYQVFGLRTQTVFYARTYADLYDYADEWYDNSPVMGSVIPSGAESLFALASNETANIDFEIPVGNVCTGIVTDSGGARLSDIDMNLYSMDGVWIDSFFTAADGSYVFRRLSEGSYCIRSYSGSMGFSDEWYRGVPAFDETIPSMAFPIDLTGGAITNIPFELDFLIVNTGVTTGKLCWIQWQAASGNTYRVQQSVRLNSWVNAPSETNGTNVIGQSLQSASSQEVFEYRSPVHFDSNLYYRVIIEP